MSGSARASTRSGTSPGRNPTIASKRCPFLLLLPAPAPPAAAAAAPPPPHRPPTSYLCPPLFLSSSPPPPIPPPPPPPSSPPRPVGTWRGWSAKGTTALGPCSFRSWQGPPGPGSGSMGEGLLTRRTAPAGEALHGSHTLLYVDSMNLIICSRCGCYASIYADNLANECLKQGHPRTAKGKQHLARVQKGAWPHPQGMPKRVREVLHVRDAQRAIAQANLDARTRLGCIA